MDAFALIGSDSGLIDAVELAAECAAPGKPHTSLIAAANALRDRVGARRAPSTLARLPGAESVTAVAATVSEIHQWIAEGSSVVASPGHDVAQITSSGLTVRELEVLRLVAAGSSDRDVAAQLFISVRTVQAHVAHMFTKLSVANRTAAVSAARRLGVLG